MKKSTARADFYVRSPDFAEHIAGVCFPPEVWAVFAQCASPRSPAEIARDTRLGETVVVAALRRLARRHLVQKNQLDWQAYLNTQRVPAAETAPGSASLSAPAAPASAALIPTASPPAAETAAAPVGAPAPAVSGIEPAPEAPLTFVVANASAAVARRVAARETLTIRMGKSVAHPANPLLPV